MLHIDSVILVNNTFVNYQDRPIRHLDLSTEGTNTGAINYILLDHNTFINGMSFHGTLSLGYVGEKVSITNNLFVDAFALGEDSTDDIRSSEWLRTGEIYPNGNNRMTWVLSVPNEVTQWAVKNNYYVVSPEGQTWLNDDHFGHGHFNVGSPLSYHINSKLGADSANAFIREDDVVLNNRPALMTNLMTWYEDPNGADRTKVTTNFVVGRDDFDRRKIEYFRDTLDAAYSTTTMAYTGAAGYPAGDLNWFPDKKTEWIADPTDVNGNKNVRITDFKLEQNYPNPFNPETKISFSIPVESKVRLEIFNVLGKKVATLINGVKSAGNYTIIFNASNLSSGIYLSRLVTPNLTISKKMSLLK